MTQNYEIFRYLFRQGDVCWRLDYDLDFSFRAFFRDSGPRYRHETNPNRLTTHLLRKFVINNLASVHCYNSERFKSTNNLLTNLCRPYPLLINIPHQ